MKIGFIGLGNMSTAIIQGLKNSKEYDLKTLYASGRDLNKLKKTTEALGINYIASNQELIDTVDVIVLGVKPEDLSSLELDLSDKPIISMAAKTPISTLIELFGDRSIIRIMPNLNAAINLGSTAYVFHKCDEKIKAHIISILQLIGSAYEIEESKMSAYIALAGSSPALIYRFIDTLANSAVGDGFSKEEALDIVSTTMIGSATFLRDSKENPQSLIKKVASKGGTTRAGLDVLDHLDFDSVLDEAAKAIIKKDKLG